MPRLLLVLPLAAALAACADVGDAPAAETSAVPAAPASATVEIPGVAVAIDTAQSRIEWTAAKVTRAHDGGFRTFRGAVYLDGARVTGADITADAASIYSDSERLTGHLKSPDFFEVETYPEVRFLVDEVTPLPDGDPAAAAGATHQAAGTLTMHGQANRVVFPAAVRADGAVVTVEADFTIRRQDWGLVYPGQPDDLIRDDVRLRLHIVAPALAAAAP